MKERKRHISAWVITQGAKPPWDQGSAISLLRDRNLLIPSNKCVPPHKLCSKRSKGHHVQNATVSGHWKPMPLPNPNTALLPSPITWGKERQGTHPTEACTIREKGSYKPAPHTEEPTHREAQAGTGGISSERRRQNGFTWFLLCFPHSPSYLYCYT